jgi:hypothetical protein
VESGSGVNLGKENEAKKNVNVNTAETSVELNQPHQQPGQQNNPEVAEPVKDKSLARYVVVTPILNLPSSETLGEEGNPIPSKGLPHSLRKASPLDPYKERLWDTAYDALCKKEPKLMKAYERDLLSFQTQDMKGIPASSSLLEN